MHKILTMSFAISSVFDVVCPVLEMEPRVLHIPDEHSTPNISSALYLFLIGKCIRCWTSAQSLKQFYEIQETLAYEYHSLPSGCQIIISAHSSGGRKPACLYAMGLIRATSLLLMLWYSCQGFYTDFVTLSILFGLQFKVFPTHHFDKKYCIEL